MRYVLSLVVMLAWGLWLGGLMTLFVTVSHLFAVDRATALIAAPEIFLSFERYQLILAGVALVATVAWRLIEPREALTMLFCFFVIASIGAIINAGSITPKMERLRHAGQSSGPAFRQLHGMSMALFSIEAIALFIAAGLIFTAIIVRPREKDAVIAPASAPPAGPADQVLSP